MYLKKALTALAVLAAIVCMPGTASAHPADMDLSMLSGSEIAMLYMKLGFTHILPLGLDHILFILALYFLNPKLKQVIWQATAFTVAHSITLGLAMTGVIAPASSIVEPIIALSIVFVAVENLFATKVNPFRIVLVFVFGLIHGLGFAGVLGELGMPEENFAKSLIMFNVGVELGQVAVILMAYLLIGKWFSEKEWYRRRVLYPVSSLIGVVALYWTIERAFFV